MPSFPNRLLKKEEAAEMYALHPATFCNWVKEGKLPHPVAWPGIEPRWRLSDLLQHIESLEPGEMRTKPEKVKA
jgi:predicted DNA-binding transcriptional regulator AlpA